MLSPLVCPIYSVSIPICGMLSFSNVGLYYPTQDNCRLTYNANESLGIYAVAIQVEDFISPSSMVAMSSVPVQFLVEVQNITIPPGVIDPTFVGTTPEDGACINVGSTYQQQITARSGGDGAK